MDSEKKVKCAECGFLLLYNLDQGEKLEADSHYRSGGHRYAQRAKTAEPMCLVLACDLRDEVIAVRLPEPNRQLAVIQKERDCSSFCVLRPGLTPKEHLEMVQTELLRQEIENRRIADEQRAEQRRKDDAANAERRLASDRAWQTEQKQIETERQEQRKNDDREWQKQQEDDKRRWQEQQKNEDRAWQKKQEADKRSFQKWMAIYAAIVGLIVTAITSWAGLNNSNPKPVQAPPAPEQQAAPIPLSK